MGDHARFIYYSLAPNETGEIPRAESFINIFDELLIKSRKPLSESEIMDLNKQAFKNAGELRAFKLQLLALMLNSSIKINIAPTLINHMLNEIDEYIIIMDSIAKGQTPLFYPIHYHLLWLSDAVGHSAAVKCGLDETEKDYIDKGAEYEKSFTDLYLKSINLSGYMRTKLTSFPPMQRLNKQSEEIMKQFKAFLKDVAALRLNAKLSGSIMPLMADHMAREECYYLIKLSMSAEDVAKPDCNPASPRIQS